MKHNGLDDINNLQQRARRLYALNRIGKEDYDFIEEHLRLLEERVIMMHERTGNTRTF
jgi:hypothetical protein